MVSLDSLKERIGRVIHSKVLLLGICLPALYLASYLIVAKATVHQRQADFWGNQASSSVQIGAFRFSEEGYRTFMGSVYHPILRWGAAVPLILFGLLLVCFLGLLLVGLVVSNAQDAADRAAEAERVKIRLQEKALEIQKMQPIIVDGQMQRICQACGTRALGDMARCPGCGRSLG